MAVKIKLMRIGKKKSPKYRIVVAEERGKREGKYIEKIGFYDPVANPHILKINKEKFDYWRLKGAKISEGMEKLIKSLK